MIQIDENSKIEIEDNNYILYYKFKNSSAKEKRHQWRVNGYFPTLEVLLQDWVRNAPAHTIVPLRSLRDVVDVIQKAEKHIEELLKQKQ